MPQINNYPTKGTPTVSDLLLIADVASNNATKSVSLGNAMVGAAISSGTPSGETDTGVAGELQYDATYLYICISTNLWRRITLPAW